MDFLNALWTDFWAQEPLELVAYLGMFAFLGGVAQRFWRRSAIKRRLRKSIAYNMAEGRKALDHGHYSDALPFFEKARELQDKAGYRPTDERVIDAEGWVVGTLERMQRGQEAIARGQKLVQLCRRELGEEHPNTLTSRNNLALALYAIGDAKGAARINREILTIRERTLGNEHQDTLTSRNNLAGALNAMGDAKGAAQMHRETLAIRERNLGKEHPHTLNSRSNLALTLYAMGDAKGAAEMHRKTLAVRERTLGVEHPDTLRSRWHLARALDRMNETEEAGLLFDGLVEMAKRTLGPDHPDTKEYRDYVMQR